MKKIKFFPKLRKSILGLIFGKEKFLSPKKIVKEKTIFDEFSSLEDGELIKKALNTLNDNLSSITSDYFCVIYGNRFCLQLKPYLIEIKLHTNRVNLILSREKKGIFLDDKIMKTNHPLIYEEFCEIVHKVVDLNKTKAEQKIEANKKDFMLL